MPVQTMDAASPFPGASIFTCDGASILPPLGASACGFGVLLLHAASDCAQGEHRSP